jgi:hypothetical protein
MSMINALAAYTNSNGDPDDAELLLEESKSLYERFTFERTARILPPAQGESFAANDEAGYEEKLPALELFDNGTATGSILFPNLWPYDDIWPYDDATIGFVSALDKVNADWRTFAAPFSGEPTEAFDYEIAMLTAQREIIKDYLATFCFNPAK